MVSKVFVPSVADPGVEAAAKADPDKFFLASKSGTLGTEVRTHLPEHVQRAGFMDTPPQVLLYRLAMPWAWHFIRAASVQSCCAATATCAGCLCPS